MNEEPTAAVLQPGEVSVRRVSNGFIIRGRACDLLDDESQRVVERVVEDADGDLGGADAAMRAVWDLFDGWMRQAWAGGLEVRVVPHGRKQPCPLCFMDGRHAAGCSLA